MQRFASSAVRLRLRTIREPRKAILTNCSSESVRSFAFPGKNRECSSRIHTCGPHFGIVLFTFSCLLGWAPRPLRLRRSARAFPKRKHLRTKRQPFDHPCIGTPARGKSFSLGAFSSCGPARTLLCDPGKLGGRPENSLRQIQECDLTVFGIPNIIDCTSLLRRANKPATL